MDHVFFFLFFFFFERIASSQKVKKSVIDLFIILTELKILHSESGGDALTTCFCFMELAKDIASSRVVNIVEFFSKRGCHFAEHKCIRVSSALTHSTPHRSSGISHCVQNSHIFLLSNELQRHQCIHINHVFTFL